MIVTIATARPFAAQKQVDSILLLTKATKDVDCKGQLAATLMKLRQAHLFAKDDREDVQTCTGQIISDISDQWVKYKLACQALVTGNDNVARMYLNRSSLCHHQATRIYGSQPSRKYV